MTWFFVFIYVGFCFSFSFTNIFNKKLTSFYFVILESFIFTILKWDFNFHSWPDSCYKFWILLDANKIHWLVNWHSIVVTLAIIDWVKQWIVMLLFAFCVYNNNFKKLILSFISNLHPKNIILHCQTNVIPMAFVYKT